MDRIVRSYGRDHPGMVDLTDFNRRVGNLLEPSKSGGVGVRGVTPFGEGRQEYVKRGGDVRGGVPVTARLVEDLEKRFASKSVGRTSALAAQFATADPKGRGVVRRADFVRSLRSAGLDVSHDDGVAHAVPGIQRARDESLVVPEV